VMSGMFGLAPRSDACRTNPVAGIERIRNGPSQAATALPPDAVADFIAAVRGDDELQRQDIGDLLAFMVLTGCRIGEAAGLRWTRVDLTASKVTFDATVVRLSGRGLFLQDHGKTIASTRTTSVAGQVLEILAARSHEAEVVFPTLFGGLRDPSDTEGLWHRNRERLGYPDLKNHGLRKTCATLLDTAGLSARAIAEYLGHAKPSMTQDIYMSRNAGTADAAARITAISGVLTGSAPVSDSRFCSDQVICAPSRTRTCNLRRSVVEREPGISRTRICVVPGVWPLMQCR
jgi:integrase